ncbi:complement C1q-like protein 3 [Saccostrea cucullata]|uniref:complement C1q-like protein 3 n=1 Tax=Saccostrea cuccullata TaxID=36930 RepID=UPI002ECFFEF4
MTTYCIVFSLILVLNFFVGTTPWTIYGDEVVAFTAKVSRDVTFGSHDIIKYDAVMTNLGKSYDPQTGIFTAPYDGLYSISCSLMAHYNNEVLLRVVKNGGKVSKLYSASKTYPQAGQTLLLLLNKGDKIWVQNDKPQSASLHDHGSYNVFSGFLIKALIK